MDLPKGFSDKGYKYSLKVKVSVTQSCPTFCDPKDCRLLCPWNSPGKNTPGDLPDPGIKPGSSVLQADSLLSEPPGKPEVSVNILLILTLHRKEGERERRKEKSERRHEYRRVDEELKGL